VGRIIVLYIWIYRTTRDEKFRMAVDNNEARFAGGN